MSDLDNMGKVIDELHYKITDGRATVWETKLRLHLKPKPDFIPQRLWAKIVNLVVVQSDQSL